MLARFCLIASLCLFGAVSAARAAEISGRVLDEKTGAPIPLAWVTAPDIVRNAETDGEGRFRLAGVPEGEHVLFVEHVNYETWRGAVRAGGPPVEISLKTKEFRADELVVTAAGYERGWMGVSTPVNVMDRKEMDQRIPFGMADLFRGELGLDVSTTGSGSVRPMIRGLFDERVLILIDGMRLSEQRPGGNHVLSIDPSRIEQIEVVRGPASVLYGSDAIGGVVNIFTRKGPSPGVLRKGWRVEQEGAYEEASEGWRSTTLLRYEGGRSRFHLGGTWKKTGNLETPGGKLPHSDHRGGTAWAGGEWSARGWRAWWDYSYMEADIGVPAEPVFLEDFFDGEKHQDLALHLVRRPPDGSGEFRLDAGWQRHNRNRYRLRTPPGEAVKGNMEIRILLDIDTYQLQPRWVRRAGDDHTLSAGAQFFYEDATSGRTIRDTDRTSAFRHPFDGVPVIPPSTRSGAGLYAQDEFKPWAKWTVTPGLRFDFIRSVCDGHPEHAIDKERKVEDRAVSGNLGIVLEIDRRWSLFANAGRAFRAPTLLERFFYGPHDASKDDVGNPDLDPERSWNFDAGVKTISDRWKGEIALFHNTVEDFIAKVDADTALVWKNLGDAELVGAEIGVEILLGGGLSCFGDLSHVRGEKKDGGESLPALPPLRAHGGLRYERRFDSVRRVWGEAAVFWSDAQTRHAPEEKETPSWNRVDLRAGWTVSRNLRLIAAVENAFDARYHDHLSRVRQDLGLDDQPGRNVKISGRVFF